MNPPLNLDVLSLSLTQAKVVGTGVVSLTWSDGVTREVDLTDMLTGHPLLKMLTIPEVFRDVEIVADGGGIGWPNGADFCAHALRFRSDEQETAKKMIKV